MLEIMAPSYAFAEQNAPQAAFRPARVSRSGEYTNQRLHICPVQSVPASAYDAGGAAVYL